MAELLSHALLAFGLFTIASWYVEWLDRRWVAVAVVGAIIPDLSRISLVVSNDAVSAALGVPFNWDGLHTIGGVIFLSALGALLFGSSLDQRRAFVLLLAASLSHLVVDLPQAYADGLMLTNLYLFPLPAWRAPTPGWYVSADRWVLVGSLSFAVVVYLVDRYRTQSAS